MVRDDVPVDLEAWWDHEDYAFADDLLTVWVHYDVCVLVAH